MTSRTQEQLLGFLLGALEAEEQQEVEEALGKDPALRVELEVLRGKLATLEAVRYRVATPPKLCERTLALVFAEGDVYASAPDNDMAAASASPAVAVARRMKRRAGAASEERSSSPRRWTVADMMVVVAVCLAAVTLLFPSLFRQKQLAMRTVCERNLVQLGNAFTEYCQARGGAYPKIPAEGNRAVAGICVPVLWDNAYINDAGILICPASPQAERRTKLVVPTLEQIDQAQGRVLANLQNTMGGSYGYPLGFVANGRLMTPQNTSRAYYPMVADAPSSSLPGLASAHHGGWGQNVAFEDNHVRFVTTCRTENLDEIFLNRQGVAAAGVDENDAVIGRSSASPLIVGGSLDQ